VVSTGRGISIRLCHRRLVGTHGFRLVGDMDGCQQ
jgi:hypothetical protein